jgi:hypothetical protein
MKDATRTTPLFMGLVTLGFIVCVIPTAQAVDCNYANDVNKYSFGWSITTLRGANLYQRARVEAL